MANAGKRSKFSLIVFLVGLLVLGVAVIFQIRGISQGNRVNAGIGGPFTMVNQNGETVTDKNFLGKTHLIFFGFTHCPDICPTKLFEMSEVFRELGPDSNKIDALFVSVDPERDTPQALKDYLSSFDENITGLTGSREQVDAIIKAYRVYARKVPSGDGPNDYTMDHTALVYLMDKNGQFINAFNLDRTPTESAKELRGFL